LHIETTSHEEEQPTEHHLESFSCPQIDFGCYFTNYWKSIMLLS